jgi:hypothetical protein
MLWWVANVILFVVVLPLIFTLINRVLTPILEIRRHARDILANVVTLTGELDDVPEQLVITDEVVKQVAAGALRYSGAVAKVAGV